jgi:uncharacterized damage-inducible protein DinB
MNMQDIQTLYDYNVWANQRVLAMAALLTDEQYIEPLAPDPGHGSIRATLVHMLDTEYGWREICQHQRVTPDITADDLPTCPLLEERWAEERATMYNYLESLRDTDLGSTFRFTTPSGAVRERVIWQVLFHIVNHSAQHRSEVAAFLTGYGRSPGDLDFLDFLREQAAGGS